MIEQNRCNDDLVVIAFIRLNPRRSQRCALHTFVEEEWRRGYAKIENSQRDFPILECSKSILTIALLVNLDISDFAYCN